jgi:multimeric flavodoxin WrbA
MQEFKQLLVVYHSRSGNTAAMAEAVVDGARSDDIDGVNVVVSDALTITPDELMRADGLILGTPENFGYMSGAMKMFFETIYYPCLEHTQGLPYACFIRAGNDGQGALASMTRIINGLRWKQVLAPIIVVGEIDEADLHACRELGMSVAAGLESGIF